MKVPKINPFKSPQDVKASPLINPMLDNREEDDEQSNEMLDSAHFNFNNNMYYLTSYEAKMRVYKMQRQMLFMLLFDIANVIMFGVFYPPLYSLVTFMGIGLYGVWKFRPNFVICYQLYIMASICLRVHVATLEEVVWKRVLFWMIVPSEFYYLYLCWYYVWEIKSLNSYDRNVLRKGWRGDHFAL